MKFLMIFFIFLIASCSSTENKTDALANSKDIAGDIEITNDSSVKSDIIANEIYNFDANDSTDSSTENETNQNKEDIVFPETTIKYSPIIRSISKNSIDIQWGSTDDQPSYIEYGTDEASLDIKSDSSSEPYPLIKSDFNLDKIQAFRHQTEISGLLPYTTYFYRVVTGSTKSKIYKFQTVSEKFKPFTAIIFGDTRTETDDHQKVVDAIMQVPHQFVTNTGDLMSTGINLNDWDTFFTIEENLLAATIVVYAIGNHEGGIGDPYFLSFLGKDSTFYDYRYQNTCWYMLDTNKDIEKSGQKEWLESKLKEDQESENSCTFKFVVFHKPLYTFSNHSPEKELRKILEPIFKKYGVNATFSGHNHCYEHFLKDGIHYIVSGGGGAPLYNIETNVSAEDKPFYVSGKKMHEFVQLDIDKTQIKVTVKDVDDGSVFEQFDITAQ